MFLNIFERFLQKLAHLVLSPLAQTPTFNTVGSPKAATKGRVLGEIKGCKFCLLALYLSPLFISERVDK